MNKGEERLSELTEEISAIRRKISRSFADEENAAEFERQWLRSEREGLEQALRNLQKEEHELRSEADIVKQQ
jgi:hypothetical protein